MNGSDVRAVASIEELVQLTELDDIVYFELWAARDAALGELTEPDLHPIKISERHDDERIEVRCMVEVEAPSVRYRVDAAAQFLLAEAVQIDEEIVQEFVERVGVMAVYPYLREGVHDLASRLRLEPPILTLLRANSVSVSGSPKPLADGETPTAE